MHEPPDGSGTGWEPGRTCWLLFLAIIALGIGIVTMPSTIQMIFGAPRLRITPKSEVEDKDDSKLLFVQVMNEPTGKLLRWLGGRRDIAQDVRLMYGLEEAGVLKSIIRLTIAKRIGPGELERGGLLGYVDKNGSAFWFDEQGQTHPWAPGFHKIMIEVRTGELTFSHSATLKIGSSRSDSDWLSSGLSP